MASPQRKPDPESLRDLEDSKRRGANRWPFGFWWVWILAFAAIWWLAFGWGNSGGYVWGGHGGGVARNVNEAVIGGPGLLMLRAGARTKHVFVGHVFMIRNVPVERAASPHALWIGNAQNSTPMLLVVPDGLNALAFAPGAELNVAGSVNKAPPAARAQRLWGLSPGDAQALAKQGAYIDGTSLLRAQQGAATDRSAEP